MRTIGRSFFFYCVYPHSHPPSPDLHERKRGESGCTHDVISAEIRLDWILFGLIPSPNLGAVLHKLCLQIYIQLRSVLAINMYLGDMAVRFK